MLAKWMASRNLQATGRYISHKPHARLLDRNVAGRSRFDTIERMKRTARLRQQRKTLYEGDHLVLSFPTGNSPTDEQCRAATRDFLDRYGVDRRNHQYLCYKHEDTDNDHLHILVNRVGRDGRVLNQDWPKKRCKQAAIETAQALGGIEETQETRSLWLERGELEVMGRELRPTPHFEAWASDCGEAHGVDLEEWTASDWQDFADAPGRFLNDIKARLERRYQENAAQGKSQSETLPVPEQDRGAPLRRAGADRDRAISSQNQLPQDDRLSRTQNQPSQNESKPETAINERHSQTTASTDLPDELQPPLNLEALAENPQDAKGKLRWIYDQLGQNQPPSGVARTLLGFGYSEEATAAIVGQSPQIQSSPHRSEIVAATKAAVNEAVQNYNDQKAQELRVASVAPICAALLDEVGQERFEGLRHTIERQGDRLRLYDHDQGLLMEAQSGDDEQWRDTGKSRLSENKALYFQQRVAPQLDSTPSRSLNRQRGELER